MTSPKPRKTPTAATVPAARPPFAVAMSLVGAAAALLVIPRVRTGLVADDFVLIAGALSHRLPGWLADLGGLSYYRPLSRQLYFSLAAPLFGANAWGYHAVNYALWLTGLWLLWKVARTLVPPGAAVVTTALLAALHGAGLLVGWAACVQELLAMAFALAALWAYVRGRSWLAAGLWLAALLSKESALVVAGGVAGFELAAVRASGRAALRRAAPVAAVGVAWAAAYYFIFQHLPGVSANERSVDLAWGAAPMLRAARLSVLALFNLEEGLGLPAARWDWVRAGLAAALSAAGVWLAAAGRPGAPAPPSPPPPRLAHAWLGAGMALAGGALVLLLGRRWSSYLVIPPAAGLCVCLAPLLARRRALAAALVGVLTFLGPLADASHVGPAEKDRQAVWTVGRLERLARFTESLREGLLQAPVRVQPGTVVYLANVPTNTIIALRGNAALQAWYRDPTLSMDYALNAPDGHLPANCFELAYDPDLNPPAWAYASAGFMLLLNRARKAQDEHLSDEAFALSETLLVKPDWERVPARWKGDVLAGLGWLLEERERHEEAARRFEDALRADPRSGRSHFGLGSALLNLRRAGDAERELAAAAELLPRDPDVYYSYAMAVSARDQAQARALLAHSVQLGLQGPRRAQAIQLLGLAPAAP